jgi:hypothetical protein
MANKKFWLVILIIVFGLVVLGITGCATPVNTKLQDSSLSPTEYSILRIEDGLKIDGERLADSFRVTKVDGKSVGTSFSQMNPFLGNDSYWLVLPPGVHKLDATWKDVTKFLKPTIKATKEFEFLPGGFYSVFGGLGSKQIIIMDITEYADTLGYRDEVYKKLK